MFGFTREEFFEADEEGRAEVNVDFSTPGTTPAATPAVDATADTQPGQPGPQP
jgi:hypothetical protein